MFSARSRVSFNTGTDRQNIGIKTLLRAENMFSPNNQPAHNPSKINSFWLIEIFFLKRLICEFKNLNFLFVVRLPIKYTLYLPFFSVSQ